MDPSLYMTEEEKAMVGTWSADSVENFWRRTADFYGGVENIGDALRLRFRKDHTVTVRYKGQDI